MKPCTAGAIVFLETADNNSRAVQYSPVGPRPQGDEGSPLLPPPSRSSAPPLPAVTQSFLGTHGTHILHLMGCLLPDSALRIRPVLHRATLSAPRHLHSFTRSTH